MDVSQLLDEARCGRLCIDLLHHIDQRRYDRAANLFTADGTFDRKGTTVFAGRDAIRGFFESRPADEAIRHLCTNIRITLRSATEASGHCYAVFYKGTARSEAELPVAIDSQTVIEYHDEYVRTEDGWRFRARRTQPIFAG